MVRRGIYGRPHRLPVPRGHCHRQARARPRRGPGRRGAGDRRAEPLLRVGCRCERPRAVRERGEPRTRRHVHRGRHVLQDRVHPVQREPKAPHARLGGGENWYPGRAHRRARPRLRAGWPRVHRARMGRQRQDGQRRHRRACGRHARGAHRQHLQARRQHRRVRGRRVERLHGRPSRLGTARGYDQRRRRDGGLRYAHEAE